MRYIPNFITSLNLAAGFISMIFIINDDIYTASWLILAAMIFDFLDGFAARALKAYSEMGKELDSLADVISFGVAPGLIIYHLLYATFSHGNKTEFSVSEFTPLMFIIIASIMPVCAALRLAKFNIDSTQTTSFKGLPTPANALAVITVVLGSYYSDSSFIATFIASPVSLIIFSSCLSGLMVSEIPFLSLKFSNLKLKGNEGRYILIVACALMIAILGIGSIPGIIPVYIIVSILSLLF